MYLKLMKPAEIQDAVARDLPLILPIGCVECHGPHLPVRCDTIIVEEVARRLERRVPWYTVDPAGPAAEGTVGRGEAMLEAMAASWAAGLGER
jgi:creatinine amidohydrolase/Fe(II)-dependent formamide hydrolase-like protein